jgi:hypothetical protein
MDCSINHITWNVHLWDDLASVLRIHIIHIQWISHKIINSNVLFQWISVRLSRCVFCMKMSHNLKQSNVNTNANLRRVWLLLPESTISLVRCRRSPSWLPRLVCLIDELWHQSQRKRGAGLSWILPSRSDGFVLPVILLHYHLLKYSGRHLALHLVTAECGRTVLRDKELKTSCYKTFI